MRFIYFDETKFSDLDFSQFKQTGRTPMAFGQPLGRLKDTIYFTRSQHSRFFQKFRKMPKPKE